MASVMATSCPLCMGIDEAESMVSVEIDRVVPKGRVAVVICRSCVAAVVRAAQASGEPLAPAPIDAKPMEITTPAAGSSSPQIAEKSDDSSDN